MLDHEYAIAFFNQPIKNSEKFLNIGKMQSGSWFIKYVHGLAGRPFGEFGRKLDSLSLTSRERRSGLSDADIPKTDIIQYLQKSTDPRKAFEEIQSIFNGHIKYFGNVFSFELHIEGFMIISSPMTRFTLHIHIR